MVRTHPQWLRARELVKSGRIGQLRAATGFFSYFNNDPKNIRNIPAYGGGAVMDIGCYPINTSRFVFGEEPTRVLGLVERDPQMKVDRLTSAMLDFPSGQSTFTCSMQLVPYQRSQFFGTKGRIEIEIPFNAPPDRPCRIFIDDGRDVFGGGITTEEFPVCDQYTIQGDAFSRAVLQGSEVPVPLEDAIRNMAVIEAIFRSAESGSGRSRREIRSNGISDWTTTFRRRGWIRDRYRPGPRAWLLSSGGYRNRFILCIVCRDGGFPPDACYRDCGGERVSGGCGTRLQEKPLVRGCCHHWPRSF